MRLEDMLAADLGAIAAAVEEVSETVTVTPADGSSSYSLTGFFASGPGEVREQRDGDGTAYDGSFTYVSSGLPTLPLPGDRVTRPDGEVWAVDGYPIQRQHGLTVLKLCAWEHWRTVRKGHYNRRR